MTTKVKLNMFTIRGDNAQIFIKIIDSISINDMCVFRMDEEKFYIQNIDPSRISFYEVYIVKDFFETYDINDKLDIGVSTKALMSVINCEKNADIMSMKFTEDKVIIMLSTSDTNSKQHIFECHQYTLEEEVLEVEDFVNDKNKITLKSTDIDLQSYCSNYAKIYSKFGIVISGNQIDILTEGDIGLSKYTCSCNLDTKHAKTKMCISLKKMAEYLSKPCKFFGNPEIDIIDESNPVHFCFMISETCEFGFYIAPIEFDINITESVDTESNNNQDPESDNDCVNCCDSDNDSANEQIDEQSSEE